MGIFGYIVVAFLVLVFIGALAGQEEQKKKQNKYKQFNQNRVPKRSKQSDKLEAEPVSVEDSSKINQKTAYKRYKSVPLYIEILACDIYPPEFIKFGDKIMNLEKMYKNGLKVKLEDEFVEDNYRSWGIDVFIEETQSYCYPMVEEADLNNPIHKEGLDTGKRITENPWLIIDLNKAGIPLTDFVIYGVDLEYFVEAVKHYNVKDWKMAQENIDKALAHKENKYYRDLKIDIELALNNSLVAEEEYNKFLVEGSSYMHPVRLKDLLQVFVHNQQYDKTLEFVKKTNFKLVKEEKIEFNQNLIGLFKCIEVPQTEETIELFEIIYTYTNKLDFRVLELIADQYSAWGMNNKSNELYQKCITLLECKNHPRIKSRIEKKIIE